MAEFISSNGRKFILFIVTLIVLGVLSWFGKTDGNGYIVALYALYVGGNVGSKYANHIGEK